jgi:cellulose synthase/poly-beta-1,6-N-acetylglucosamine synthase-like glycosyltransferase
MKTDIYMTSFFRREFLEKAVQLIWERTDPDTFQIHVYDNASDKPTRDFLYGMLEQGRIVSLMLDSRNTGCLYNKIVFHAMTESANPYYVVTDNDIFPPKLSPDWLKQMTGLMDKYPEIALLTPQFPPQQLSGPYSMNEDVVYCKAVGNAFKMVRRALFPIAKMEQALGKYGDDGYVSDMLEREGYKSAFCRHLFCLHAGQCVDWGYKKEEIHKDPRKVGYGTHFQYMVQDEETYLPEPAWRVG